MTDQLIARAYAARWIAHEVGYTDKAPVSRMFRLIVDGYGIDRMKRIVRLSDPIVAKARKDRERAAKKAYREMVKKGIVYGFR